MNYEMISDAIRQDSAAESRRSEPKTTLFGEVILHKSRFGD